jgi:hypothetical protein
MTITNAHAALRRNTMNAAVITERIRVDAHHAVHIVDARLVPGEEVEVIVRPAQAVNTVVPSLWDLASTMRIDAPADFSVNFEQVLR